MQTHLITNRHITIRLASIAWALSLLAPFLVIAGSHNGRWVFHISIFVAGWLSWTFVEYYLHRFIMHEGKQDKGLGKILNHNHHHVDPGDIRMRTHHRVWMLSGSIGLAGLSGILNDYCTLACGFVIGFTAYSYMHIVLHHRWSARLFPQLHRFHIHHHCRHPDKCFGVTFTWWDRLFGTVPAGNTSISERIRSFYYKDQNEGKNISISADNTNGVSCLGCSNRPCSLKTFRASPGTHLH